MSKLSITVFCIAFCVLINMGYSDGQIRSGEQKCMLVQGEQAKNGTWILLPSYQISLPAGSQDFTKVGYGNFSIVLMNSSGNVLSIRYFDPQPSHIDRLNPTVSIAEPLSFIEIIPLPENASIIELRERNMSLIRVWKSENPPVVQIISIKSASGYLEPRWSGMDADDDSLLYMIQYSNGASRGKAGERQDAEWRTIAADLKDEKLSLDLSKLPGGDRARIRVLATDGFNTGVAVSSSFKVENKPPVASIIYPPPDYPTPGHRTIIGKGDRLVLIGTASDIEDGLLNGSSLSWYASHDGLLGTGRRLDVTTLSPGVHEITVEATDNDSSVGSATIVVEVIKPINRQPIADAGSDQSINLFASTKLNGTGSFDGDGDKLLYNWSIVNGPAGNKLVISDPHIAEPTFSSDSSGKYEIELAVSDGMVGSVPDRIIINVNSPFFGIGMSLILPIFLILIAYLVYRLIKSGKILG